MSTIPDQPQSNLRGDLAAAGLTDDVIRRVVLRGETERDSETPFDPPTRGGMTAYYERVRALREELVPLGWSVDNTKNFCTTVSPCGGYAVAFVSGDAFTAGEDRTPQPTYPRGAATAYAVNKAQLHLFDEPEPEEDALPQVWFVVVHRPPGQSEVRVELSLPEAIADDGTVTRWVERHPLEIIDITTPPPLDDHDEVEEVVEVQVGRKRVKDFSAARLELARRRRSLTQKEVASRAGITSRSLSGYERGVSVPSPKTVRKLATALEFPEAFFLRPEPVPLAEEGASFRALSTMTARRRHAVLAAGAIAMDVNEWLEARFDLPSADLPADLDIDTPATAATALRAHWGLAERPISNMVHLLESKGVRVFSLTEDCVTVDAFSIWIGAVPFVFLNMMKSGERGALRCRARAGAPRPAPARRPERP